MFAKRIAWLAALAVLVPPVAVCGAQPERAVPQETKAQRDQRMAWWREARFGMFIHWGLYAIPAGQWNGQKIGGAGEWIMNTAKIPVSQYEPLQKQFNPVKFDAHQWARIAKGAGMRYIVITSKHHDGFCLFDSKLTDYDVMGTPFRRDILKELADACRAEGLRICWYHSIMDWHHPDYLPRRPWDPRPGLTPDFNRYIEHLKGQLRELTTNYGKIGVLWFDGEWENTWTHEHGKMLYQYVRSLDPDIIINNRVDKGRQGMAGLTAKGDFAGDFGTPEQEIPATGLPGVDWESCMTMNDTWGFKADDHHWKSAETLVRNLIDIASKGGNYLLNVGPTAEGLIPEPSVQRLARMGQWMKVHGESIYGTSASPFKRLAWGRATQKPGKIYLHVFDWPKGPLVVPGLKNPVTKAFLLADKDRALEVSTSDDGVAIQLPEQAPDKIASVVVLEIAGKPEVVNPSLAQAADGSITLPAAEAVVHGQTARYESGHGKDNIGFWTNPKDQVSWEFAVKKPGKFQVLVTYACEPGAGGSTFSIVVGDQKLSGKVEETGSWTQFVEKRLGELRLPGAGRFTLTVTPETMPRGAVMNLKAVTLRPQ
jgi:alpha-L-fucosidase